MATVRALHKGRRRAYVELPAEASCEAGSLLVPATLIAHELKLGYGAGWSVRTVLASLLNEHGELIAKIVGSIGSFDDMSES